MDVAVESTTRYCRSLGFCPDGSKISVPHMDYWEVHTWLEKSGYCFEIDFVCISTPTDAYNDPEHLSFLFKDPELAILAKLMHG